MNALVIANTQIRRDPSGRYCLNDLHQASGGSKRHQPSNWLRSDQAQELILELTKSEEGFLKSEEAPPANSSELRGWSRNSCSDPFETVNDGFANGTYAVKELVYAYAMWISPKFHLAVIRAYDELVTGRVPPVATEPASVALPLWGSHRADAVVAASRTFRALMSAGRQMGARPHEVTEAAARSAAQLHGVDVLHLLRSMGLTPPPGTPATREQSEALWRYANECGTSFHVEEALARMGLPRGMRGGYQFVLDAMIELGFGLDRGGDALSIVWPERGE